MILVTRATGTVGGREPLLADLVNSGALKVVGAEYQLKTGVVDMVVQ